MKFIFYCMIVLVACSTAAHAVPQLISYQGRLTNAGGNPVPDGSYTVLFRLYTDSLNLVDKRWEEAQTVETRNGLFTAKLGAILPIPQWVLAYENLFLALKVGTDPEIVPRTRLTSAPYARRIETVEGAAGGTVYGNLSVAGKLLVQSESGVAAELRTNSTAAGAAGVFGEYFGQGPYNYPGVKGMSKPQDHYGFGGEFEGGWIGAYGKVLPTGNNPADIYLGIDGNAIATLPNQDVTLFGTYGYSEGARQMYGVYGQTGGSLNAPGSAIGVYGHADCFNPVDGTNYGLYGYASSGKVNYGLYAYGVDMAAVLDGDVQIYGTLAKSGGSFRIDHPLDPEHKYLQHSFVESPDMMNVYNGNVTLDSDGKAVVTMPEWFEILNRDFRYQLTALGEPGPNLYIAQKVSGNQFTIAGGAPGMEVSWQVTGIRQDPWAEANRIQVELTKSPEDQGTYIHPKAHGKPATLAESYRATKIAEKTAELTRKHQSRLAASQAEKHD